MKKKQELIADLLNKSRPDAEEFIRDVKSAVPDGASLSEIIHALRALPPIERTAANVVIALGGNPKRLAHRLPVSSQVAPSRKPDERFVTATSLSTPQRHQTAHRDSLEAIRDSQDEGESSDHWCRSSDFAEFQRRARPEIVRFVSEQCERKTLEWYGKRPAQPARYRALKTPLPEAVSESLRALRIEPLFLHQSESLDALRASKNVLLVTQTASGKTWCYNPAIFEALINQPGGKALYVFPLNVLLIDQKEKIDQLREQLASRGIQVSAEILWGGVAPTLEERRERRRAIARQSPDILGLNPELLSTVLSEAERQKLDWSSYFRNLKFVVVDEVHTYRGLLGIHMAGLLRRLLILCRQYGALPQFVLGSATVRNPRDIASRLTSLSPESFVVFDEDDDGSSQETKHWVVLDPDEIGAGRNAHDRHLDAAANNMVDLLCAEDDRGRPAPLHTIVFAKSIRDVHKIHDAVQRKLRIRRPDLLGKVTAFASAELSPKEKRQIYEGLLHKRLVGVVSTNALEAGVDIGSLDACVIAGFPFTVMRMRQMAGRVGRRAEGLVAFLPYSPSPVDQFYRTHPHLLLEQKPEAYVIDHNNSYIMRRHLNAAALRPGGIRLEEVRAFGEKAEDMLKAALDSGVLHQSDKRYVGTPIHYSNKKHEYAIGDIRAGEQNPYLICQHPSQNCWSLKCDDHDSQCEHRVGVLDRQYIYRDCHPGAIYESREGDLHEAYELDDVNRIVRVMPSEETPRRTFAAEETTVGILGSPSGQRELPGGVRLAWGRVKVERTFSGYFSYTVVRRRRCRRCRVVYEAEVERCPRCGRAAEEFLDPTKPEYRDFSPPYAKRVFKLTLNTIAAWLVIPIALSDKLRLASPCKLPDPDNGVQKFLSNPLTIPAGASDAEAQTLREYHTEAAPALLKTTRENHKNTIVFPGVYGQCLHHWLASRLPETRAKQLFAQTTGYPIDKQSAHICVNCRSGMLFPAMHTLEHAVLMRYPSVALGDLDDLGSHSLPAHAQTGGPTIFWYDNFEGGLGAAEKVYDQFESLLDHAGTTLRDCACRTPGGCPRCTQMAHCDQHNEGLNKIAGQLLAVLLLGREPDIAFEPFVFQGDRQREFRQQAKHNEYVAPNQGGKQETRLAHHEILRVQPEAHDPVIDEALEIRAVEIGQEVPPIGEIELYEAYNGLKALPRPKEWTISPGTAPYRVLEILETASNRMFRRIYRLLAKYFHPDANPARRDWATMMMQLVNEAEDRIRTERAKAKPDVTYEPFEEA